MNDDNVKRRYVIFNRPWGKRSWLVDYDGHYENDRKAHVELGENNMNSVLAGHKANLINLRKERNAIMWTVDNVYNHQGKLAHFTVAFGPSINTRDLVDFK